MRSFLYPFLLCAACSSSEDPGSDAGVDPACTPAGVTATLVPGVTWRLRAVASDATGPWAVVEKRLAGAATSSLVIADANGEGATLVPELAETSGLEVAALVAGGKRCAALHLFDETFMFACEGSPIEAPPLELGGRLVAVEAPDGTVHVFGQDFAAFHELQRSAGQWREVEKFESSISTAEDAVLLGSRVAACFLDAADRPSIDLANDTHPAAVEARWCKLVPGGELGVLTDVGLASFAGGAISAFTATPVTERPLAVGRAAAGPFAIVQAGGGIVLQPLPAGTATPLVTVDTGAEVRAQVAGERVFVTSLSATAAGSSLTTSTRCLE